MSNNSNKLIIAAIVIIAIFLIGNQLGLFSVYQNSLSFPYSGVVFGTTGSSPNTIDLTYRSYPCAWGTPGPDIGQCASTGENSKTTFGFDAEWNCDSDGSCYFTDLRFELVNKDAQSQNGKIVIPAYLDLYMTGAGTWQHTYYSINTPITCSSTGCTGTEITGLPTDSSLHFYLINLSSYISTVNITHIYVARYTDKRPQGGGYGGGIVDIQTNLVIQNPCTEGQLTQVGGVYYLCHAGTFSPAYLTTLSPTEQAAIIAQINALNLTAQQQAAIISNLTSNIADQATLINQLQADTAQKAALIQALSSNITYQAQLITSMQLTVTQQAQTIQALSSNITYQGQLIAQLQTNLDNKILLINQLQVENQNQAQLIAAMNLSFQNQAYIINQLSSNITDDAQIINNLGYTIQNQADLITQLNLQRDQLAQLVSDMSLSNSETAQLINDLNLKVEDQVLIISQLNLSLQQEQDLVTQLRLTIDQQNQVIADLQNGTGTATSATTFDWDTYKWPIIIGGGVVLLLLLLGGRKK